MHPAHLHTERLTLIAMTPEQAAAGLRGNAALEQMLGVRVPDAWPPEVLLDVQEMFARNLAANPHQVGWWGWYVVANAGVVGREATLIGSAGVGPPDGAGRCVGGYSVLPPFEGQGFTTEAARSVFGWAEMQPGVRRLEATTFERHHASRRILEKLGFGLVGVSPDDAAAAESDRQGRGPLLLYRRAIVGRGS